jgi:hypothetical protein
MNNAVLMTLKKESDPNAVAEKLQKRGLKTTVLEKLGVVAALGDAKLLDSVFGTKIEFGSVERNGGVDLTWDSAIEPTAPAEIAADVEHIVLDKPSFFADMASFTEDVWVN